MKSIDIVKTDKIFKIVTFHEVPEGYEVGGNPRFILNADDDISVIISKIKFCLESSKTNYKKPDNENLEDFSKELFKRSGYKTYKKFYENAKHLIINQEKKMFKFFPQVYDIKKKSSFPDNSREIIDLPISVDDETFFKVVNELLG